MLTKIVITWKYDADSQAQNGLEDGTVLFSKPEEGKRVSAKDPSNPNSQDVYSGHYTLDINWLTDDGMPGWIYNEDDGFYYYVCYSETDSDDDDSGDSKPVIKPQSVESGGETAYLINSWKQVNIPDAPAGYILSVDVIVQTVQAVGCTDKPEIDADLDAWKSYPSPQN